MRYTWLIILSIIFLLLVYTAKFWMEWIDFVGLLMTSVVLVSGLLFLGTCLIWHLVFGIKEKFKDRERIVVIAVLFVVVPVAYFQPFGLITPDRFDGKDILVAQREGVANCMTVFRLKENSTFQEEISCFGIERITGEYKLKNDTLLNQVENLNRIMNLL